MSNAELRPGTAAYARKLASCMAADICLGPTDATLCAKALRSVAGRLLRRGGAALAVVMVAAGIAVVGVADRNGDGRVDIADLWLGAEAMASVLPAAVGGAGVIGGRHM